MRDSELENAKRLLRFIYGNVLPSNPYFISVEDLVRRFHGTGGHLPASMSPSDLSNPASFFRAVERAAGAAKIDEIARIANIFPADTDFHTELRTLQHQAEAPVLIACFVATNSTASLRRFLSQCLQR